MKDKITPLTLVCSFIILVLLVLSAVIHLKRIAELEAQNSLLIQVVENQNQILNCRE